jgi:hypothetical protein
VGVPDRVAILETMNDMYKGYGAQDVPTAQLRVPGTTPGAPRGKGPGNGWWSPGKRAAAVLAACALIGGGTYAAVAATSSPSTALSATTQAAAQTGAAVNSTEQAQVLTAAITTPSVRRIQRLRLLGGMYGQLTFETKSGPRTLAYERGTITVVGNGDVVIRATDGTTYTWILTSTSVVREDGTKETTSTLATGQTVFAGGLVTDGNRDARLIVIRKATTTPNSSATKASTAA